RAQQHRLSVTVPKGAKTGRLQVLNQGREICAVDLAIAKKDDGLLIDAPAGRGLVGNIYKLPENTQALPDFGTMTPIGSIVVPNIAVAPRAFDTGFPGVNVKGAQLVEWFGIRFEGVLVVDQAGAYQFEVNSDDGARIYIDDHLIVANDGIHPPTKVTGEATLSKGDHRIRIDYYQGPRVEIALELRWKVPGAKELTIIPKAAFRRGMGPQQ
ncbi:MAG: PA14 domain-containing protein, partial [Myxococcota bacterium]|nr:PA14 domain-containing protein [Myxococcota bacterium]